MQCILCHFVLNKRKVLLDQLKEGLKVNGLLDEITDHPDILAPLFTWTENSVNASIVKSKLRFPPLCGDHVMKVMLLHFIDESSEQG